MFFLQKSASSVNRLQAHLAKRKRIGWAIGFNSWTNWTLYGVLPRSSCRIRLNDVSEMFNCWERRWIDVDGAFCHSSKFLAFHTLVYRGGCQFLSLFSQDTNIRRADGASLLPKFSGLSYAIFAHILQHYHDFQSNVAIFSSFVQAYTQPYSFGGRLKLIICQIRLELSATIHEISTRWKQTLDGGPYICTCVYVFVFIQLKVN